MTVSKVSPGNAKAAKLNVKAAPAKARVEAAAEAKLLADAAHEAAIMRDGSPVGAAEGAGGNAALILGGIAVLGGLAAAAAGGGGGDDITVTPAPVTVTPAPTPPPATYALAAGGTSVNEGSTAIFTLTTTNVTAGSPVAYTISGVSADDVVGGKLTGNATVGADGKALIEVQLVADASTEGAETLTVTAGGKTASVSVADTSLTPAAVAKSFELKATVDTLTGGDAGDTFVADETTTAVVSLADHLDGGAGSDSLTIYNSKGVAPQLTSIETVTLNTIADSVNFDASTATGLTSLNVTAAGGTNAFTVGAGAAVSLANSVIDSAAGNDVTINYDAKATSASLTLNKVTSAGAASDLAVAGAALATLNIATAGSASTVDAIVLPAKVDSLVVTGDKALTVVDAFALATNATTKASSITSTGLTGDLSLSLSGIAANQDFSVKAGDGVNTLTFADVHVDGSLAVTTGAGKDVLTLSDATGSVSIKTGAGDDKVTVSELDSKFNATDKETALVDLGAGDDTLVLATGLTEANLASGVTLAGGDGTDTLAAFNAEYLKLFDNATADVAISGFEKLALQNTDSGVFDLSKVVGITTVVAASGVNIGGNLTLSNAAANSTLDWTVKDANLTAGGTVTASLKDSSGSADAFNVVATLSDANDTADTLSIALTTNKDANNKALEVLNVTSNATLGSTALAPTLKATDQVLTISTLDLVGGTTTVNIGGTASTVISGYANATSLVTVDASKSSGSNNLSVAAGTTFVGGTGSDTFTGTQAQFAGLTSLNGGAGTKDTVKVTDTAATTASLVIDDKAFKNVSAVEAVTFSGAIAGDFTWVVGGYANTFATNNSGVITATATALAAGAAGDDVTVDASGLSGTNAISLTLTDTAAGGFANKITVTGSAGADTLKVTEAATAGTSKAVINVDGGAGDDTITVTATLHAAGTVTIAGGAGADTITGSAGVDTITGGAGADKITGGEGSDSITGGTGADTIILTETTAASDTLVIAAGDSAVDGRDTVTGFALNSDVLDLVGAGNVQANGVNDGADNNTIKSHSITSGVITFDDDNTFATAVVVNSTNLSDVLGYLGANITTAAATVGFAYDSDSDGTADAFMVFQNNAAGDILVQLSSLTGVSALSTTAAAGTITIA